MTETEVLNWLIEQTDKTVEEVREFCHFNNLTLDGYKEYVERAKAARAKSMPEDYPRAILTKRQPD